jgi:lipid II:glycine glycyltransferase (peptidoglycan interpeptide bridge formation enzyme)
MAFYEMHAHVRKTKYRLLAQPVRFFENIHRVFGKRDELFVLLAEREGETVAGTLFIKQGDVLYYKFNASKATELRPNDLIVWHGMLLGNQLGLASLDFGVSALSQPGLIHFKRKFATEESEVVQLSWSPPNYTNTQGQEIGALLGKLTNALTEEGVSASAGQFASEALYRFFC